MSIEVGKVLEGKVTGITNFGAFVQIEGGQTGLVHISEVADTYVRDIKDHLQENDTIKVKVINVQNGKIGLSIKQVNTEGVVARPSFSGRPPRSGGPPRRGGGSLDNKLSHFLKDSEERLSGLRRNQDAKRGGRGSRRDFN